VVGNTTGGYKCGEGAARGMGTPDRSQVGAIQNNGPTGRLFSQGSFLFPTMPRNGSTLPPV
jgi:hypothetical protein